MTAMPPRSRHSASEQAATIRDRTFQQALTCHRQGQLALAKTLYEKVLKMHPQHLDTLQQLGLLALQTQNFHPAAELFGMAIAIDNQRYANHFHQGLALQAQGKFDAALACYDRSIALQPALAPAYCNRGIVLKQLQRFEQAQTSLNQAIALQPEMAEAYSNLADALVSMNRFDEALAHCEQAIALQPHYADAYYNRGVALQGLTRMDEAISSFRQAITLQPTDIDAQCNLAQALLMQGDFEAGWPLYEARWQSTKFTSQTRNFKQPLWLGKKPLQGKTILLHSEQGLGDSIQFCRYIPLLAARGARILLEIEPALATILGSLDRVAQIYHKGEALPAFDFHCPLMSLPLALESRLETIPSLHPYLKADEGQQEQWRNKAKSNGQPRIGLAWSGNHQHRNDHNRSLPLAQLLPCLPAGFQYISLQKEVRQDDQPALLAHPGILHFGSDLHDFSDTAALIQTLDLVISVDSSVAHLSAALGTPTWILLPFAPDWRWMLNRSDSPWYPSVRLYRQTRHNNWDEVLHTLARDLITQHGQ
jgi:tetratricopeptide (TPR) repeat protein